MIKATINDAWKLAHALIPNLGELKLDPRAGYKISNSSSGSGYVCDLGTRLELNFKDGSSKNIWIVQEG